MAKLTVKKTSGGNKYRIFLGGISVSNDLFDKREYAIKEAQRLVRLQGYELASDIS